MSSNPLWLRSITEPIELQLGSNEFNWFLVQLPWLTTPGTLPSSAPPTLRGAVWDKRRLQTADWQVNEVNIAVKCFNRFPIPKLDFKITLTLGIGNLLKHSTTRFTSFTCQSESLQSVFVLHHPLESRAANSHIEGHANIFSWQIQVLPKIFFTSATSCEVYTQRW